MFNQLNFIIMNSFLTIDNLPTNKKFVDLPYKNEIIQFTGRILGSEEIADFGNSYKYAEVLINNNKGQKMLSSLRFTYCIEKSQYVKDLDCNFYQLSN